MKRTNMNKIITIKLENKNKKKMCMMEFIEVIMVTYFIKISLNFGPKSSFYRSFAFLYQLSSFICQLFYAFLIIQP